MPNRQKAKRPPVPPVRYKTLRREIIAVLSLGHVLTARELSIEVGATEQAVAESLVHIKKTLQRRGQALAITPAQCMKCGFTFTKRTRLTRPGRCPLCREGSITEPLFGLKGPRGEQP